jgi:hypothetical protein
MEAWDAIESPCDVIFSRVRDTVPLSLPNHMEHLHTSTRNHPPKLQEQPRVNRIRHGGVSRSLRPNPKLLFIRDATTSPPVIAKMACPDCSRDDFANIQGLLNHCRLRHQKDYGSHDECMQKCAVIVSEEESEWVLTNGQELGGVSLPSLRRLFEIAVGVESSSVMDIIDSATPSKLIPEKEITLGTHLARTLGHHKDTPALAPFLGRSPKRRCINVFDDHGFVDITGDALPPQRPIWRMPYTHRNVARPGLDTVVPEALPDASIVGSHQGPAVDSPSSFRTRFHIVARVVISDRSLWLPPGESLCIAAGFHCKRYFTERRTQANQEHTHRWMLSIDSPSYVSLPAAKSVFER